MFTGYSDKTVAALYFVPLRRAGERDKGAILFCKREWPL